MQRQFNGRWPCQGRASDGRNPRGAATPVALTLTPAPARSARPLRRTNTDRPIFGDGAAHLVHVVVRDLRVVDELPEVRAALQNGVAIDAHRRAIFVFDAT